MIILLAASWVLGPQTASAAPPSALTSFTGTLSPGESITRVWELNSAVEEPGFLFHYSVIGGSDFNDVAYVYVDETGDGWDYLKGEGWTYCSPLSPPPCPLDRGQYSVTISADDAATAPMTYDIGFYLPPNPPAVFSGHIPADSDVRVSSFGVLLASASAGDFSLEVTSGSYDFLIDGVSAAVVTSNTALTVNLAKGFHQLEVSTEVEGATEDVTWSVRLPPKLEVRIINPCPTLNESVQSVCVIGAEAAASDGSSPVVSYQWTASGGTFNSTSGQWVEWTAPPGTAGFTLTVLATAPGYLSSEDSTVTQVVPEFTSAALSFLVAVLLAIALLRRRSRRV